ncbi:MAG TPA: PTS sugar transporter subunit IIA [Pseudoflavonifractor sp.]|nr:PTS sugar transporter subunit IIA [Pseudoflavonifractor sp.]
MLTDLIKKENITVSVEAGDWEDAIEKSAQSLIRDGSIEPRYVMGMIQAVKDLGPYIAVAPGMAIAHARPESGVIRTGIALTTLKTPVPFGSRDNDPIQLVITLAAEDHDAHLNAMGDLVDVLSDPARVQGILDAETADEIYTYLIADKGAGER